MLVTRHSKRTAYYLKAANRDEADVWPTRTYLARGSMGIDPRISSSVIRPVGRSIDA